MFWIRFLQRRLCNDVLGLIFSFLSVTEFYGVELQQQWWRVSIHHKPPVISAFDQKARRQFQSAYWNALSPIHPAIDDMCLTDNPLLLDWFPTLTNNIVYHLCRKGCSRILQTLIEIDESVKVDSEMIEDSVRSGSEDLVSLLFNHFTGDPDPYLVTVAIDARSFEILRYLVCVHKLPVFVSQFDRAVHNLRKEEIALLRHFREPISDRFLALPSANVVMFMIDCAHTRFLPLLLQICETTPLLTINLSHFILAKFRAVHEHDGHTTHLCCFV